MDKVNFIKDNPHNVIGTAIVANRGDINSNASNLIGDFLSRLWTNFGAPNSIDYEGFSYALKHMPSGITFTAYSGASGPAYGGSDQDKTRLIPILAELEDILSSSVPVDCKIEYDTDFGRVKSGAKNGKPFDLEVK